MTGPRLRAALAASVLALALGGCVAAAIPVLAGGAVLARDKDGSKDRPASDLAAPQFEGPGPAPAPTPAPTLDASPVRDMVEMREGAVLAAPGAMFDDRWQAFLAHASEAAASDPIDDPRTSAILAAPGSLAPNMTDCAILPPAVLIDLDPAEEALDMASITPDRALAQGLAALRMQNVEVFWISGESAAVAGTLRARLRETGLDPAARDGLLLMRRAEDRKQLRRKELSQTHCVVAIAGDQRSDFDELFAYLKDPEAATELDVLLGDGWFLVPQAATGAAE